MERKEIESLIADLGLTMKAAFVPWSQSRSAKPKPKQTDYNLNWKVTILRKEREILTTDYSAGIAHAPAYAQFQKTKLQWDFQAVLYECEHGKIARRWPGQERVMASATPILPELLDVLYSLVTDSDVLNYPTYEEWASDCGYDPDSRKGEAIYRACLEIALRLNNGIGADNLGKLREAFQDY